MKLGKDIQTFGVFQKAEKGAQNDPKISKNNSTEKRENIPSGDVAIKNYVLAGIAFKGKEKPTPTYQDFGIKEEKLNEHNKPLVDKFLSDERLYENENLKREISFIVRYTNTDEAINTKIKLIDKFLSDERLYENEDLKSKIGEIVDTTDSDEEAEAKIKLIDKLLSDERLYENESIKDELGEIINSTNSGEDAVAKIELINKFLSDEKWQENEDLKSKISEIIGSIHSKEVTEAKIKLIDKFLSDEKWQENESIKSEIDKTIKSARSNEEAEAKIKLIDEFLSNERWQENEKEEKEFKYIIDSIHSKEEGEAKTKLIVKIFSDEKLYENENLKSEIGNIVKSTKSNEEAEAKIKLIDKFLSDERLYENEDLKSKIGKIVDTTDSDEEAEAKIKLFDEYLYDERWQENEDLKNKFGEIVNSTNSNEAAEIKIKFINQFLSNGKWHENEFLKNKIEEIIYSKYSNKTSDIEIKLIDKFLYDEKLYENESMKNKVDKIINSIRSIEEGEAKIKLIDKFLYDEKWQENESIKSAIGIIVHSAYSNEVAKAKIDLIDKILSDERLYENESVKNEFCHIVHNVKSNEEAEAKIKLINKFLSDEKLYENEDLKSELGKLINNCNDDDIFKIIQKVLDEEENIDKTTASNLAKLPTYIKRSNKIEAIKLVDKRKELELTLNAITAMLSKYKLSYQNIKKINNAVGIKNVNKLSVLDLYTASKTLGAYNKKNINEISTFTKKTLLSGLVSMNTELFEVSEEFKKLFPLIPTNQEDYCKLLPSIVRSIGIETNILSADKKETFDIALNSLAETLEKLSDEEFSKLEISQKYSREDFISDVLSTIENLPKKEVQKVYDYFGFELHHSKTKTNFTLTGYPVNMDNKEKLSQVENQETKEIIEKLKPFVIKFSQNNKVQCNDKEIEKLLNDIVEILPEFRPQIGKLQHKTHNFDIAQHSLKVMQKIAQNPEFKELNKSDKKVMLLGALLHDIAKIEGEIDKIHEKESAFDAFFIAKKFDLSKKEEQKLYSLIKHHNWLERVNTVNFGVDYIKETQSVAFDLQYDNLFNMSKIFTQADLKAVKTNDDFYNTYEEALINNSQQIEKNIKELQKSQPLLPVTKFPKASKINEAIEYVNPDGSTNIKGVYKNEKGLVILKYNEIENWEEIGFPKGSISKGIKITNYKDEKIDTGNIKFFVHGLDYSNQLAKFDAFSLVDSDALLSLSYAERPESKYRFFRPQGVILDYDTNNIHGGGNSDSGSGYGKSINDFKNNYIFGGTREDDRLYISELIKKATGLNNEEYYHFVKKNENKPLSEIEPKEYREKIIKAFATINSNTRNGNREYNEMFGTSPNGVMGVFAYSIDYDEKINNPIEFLNRKTVGEHEKGYGNTGGISVAKRTRFLQEYALEHDVPFVIFGD